ncbi:hypothetical protein Vretifemale_12589 [Volvox reticuliferus]|uniref:Kinesin motor domain-containing protein n=1 Tax=Volvox reticuliferus TaxID=1737510 RepID=A0A8J4FS96_9CHLO|nr:hypothetical protein Vretifemale_12589 [Volvox reticuliferus]
MRDGAATAFSFDRVFEGSEQQAFFDTAIEPLVADLISMRIASSVYMAYGASGTGKSYTMQGTAEQPGMIPRTLQRLFQMLTERGLEHQVQLSYYEVYGNKVTDLLRPLNTEKGGGTARAVHPGAKFGGHQHKERPTLPIVRMGAGFCLPGLLLVSGPYVSARLSPEAACGRCLGWLCCVRLSLQTSLNKQHLHLATAWTRLYGKLVLAGYAIGLIAFPGDLHWPVRPHTRPTGATGALAASHSNPRHGCCRQCHSSSAEEGLGLFRAAARHRKKDVTKVNNESSRSHAVFTIQLLEVEGGLVQGRSATLSLVDLAGAERATQTQHVGSKLRESAEINSSLSVLRRCLEALRHNQTLAQRAAAAGAAAQIGGNRMRAPVRESGLTTLFSSVLSGQGNLAFSVHLSPHLEDYALTLESLKLGALASQVTMTAAAPEAAVMPPPPPPLAAPQRSRGGVGGRCGLSSSDAAAVAVPGHIRPLARVAPGVAGARKPISEVLEEVVEEEEEERQEEGPANGGAGGEGVGAEATQIDGMTQQQEEVEEEEEEAGVRVEMDPIELCGHHKDQPMAALGREAEEEPVQVAAMGVGAAAEGGAAVDKVELPAAAVTVRNAAAAAVVAIGPAAALGVTLAAPQTLAESADHPYDLVVAGGVGARRDLQEDEDVDNDGGYAAAGDQEGAVSGLLQQLQEQLADLHSSVTQGGQAASAAGTIWATVICTLYDSMGRAIRRAVSLERQLASSRRDLLMERPHKKLRTALPRLQDQQPQTQQVMNKGQMEEGQTQGHVHIGLHRQHNNPRGPKGTLIVEEASMARANVDVDVVKPHNVVVSATDPGVTCRSAILVESGHTGGSSYRGTARAAVAMTTAHAIEAPRPRCEAIQEEEEDEEEEEEEAEGATGRQSAGGLQGKRSASHKPGKRRRRDGGDSGGSEDNDACSSRGQGGDAHGQLTAIAAVVAASSAAASGLETTKPKRGKGRPGKRPRDDDRNGGTDGGDDSAANRDPSACGPGRTAGAAAVTVDGAGAPDSKLCSSSITGIPTPVAGRTRRAKQQAAAP